MYCLSSETIPTIKLQLVTEAIIYNFLRKVNFLQEIMTNVYNLYHIDRYIYI